MAQDERSVHILRKIVIDTFILSGLIACIFVTNKAWEPFQRGFFCDDESLMLPYRSSTVSVQVLKGVGLALPIIGIIICEWALLRKEGFAQECLGVKIPKWMTGAYCSIMGFFFGLCFTELTTNITKNIIGRLRPHFFEVCQPSVDCQSLQWQHRYVQAHEFHCTNTMGNYNEARKSFLSGHSSWAAFTMIYLALYLERRMVSYGTRSIRHMMQFVTVMLSWFTALSRISDYKHHWSDVLAGYLLGLTMACLMFNWGTEWVEKRKKHETLQLGDVAPHHVITSPPSIT